MIDPTVSYPFPPQTLHLNAAACNPIPIVTHWQDNPYTMIASAELEQLRAENARLVAAEKVAQNLLHELDRLRARIAELEEQG